VLLWHSCKNKTGRLLEVSMGRSSGGAENDRRRPEIGDRRKAMRRRATALDRPVGGTSMTMATQKIGSTDNQPFGDWDDNLCKPVETALNCRRDPRLRASTQHPAVPRTANFGGRDC
jgi:hypothetical protein